MSDLLDLDNVHKNYGHYHALKGLTFTVPGGTFGLLGPNGAGKSTLLKVLLGLLDFTGSARVFGIDVRERPTGGTTDDLYRPFSRLAEWIGDLNADAGYLRVFESGESSRRAIAVLRGRPASGEA